MRVRAALLAVTAAALLPLTGTSHASCLDDATTGLEAGYGSDSPKSQYWNEGDYLHHSGLATVTLHGDALVADYKSYYVDDTVRYAVIVVGNAPGVVPAFVDCVAG